MASEKWHTLSGMKSSVDHAELLQFFPEDLQTELEMILKSGMPICIPEWPEREIKLMNALLWHRIDFGNRMLGLVFAYGFLQGQLYETDRMEYIKTSQRYYKELADRTKKRLRHNI